VADNAASLHRFYQVFAALDAATMAACYAADDTAGSVHWEARYRFSATGRLVWNRTDAHLRFDADGCIAEHCDDFDFWRWSRQALGHRACCWAGRPTCVARSARRRVRAWTAILLAGRSRHRHFLLPEADAHAYACRGQALALDTAHAAACRESCSEHSA